jgi:predicted ATP-binding protein involved in virulence
MDNKITKSNINNTGVKIRRIYIESYKMFNDFNINFLDKNDKITPIIVIAGINGSGKTSLLEYIKNFETSPKFDCEDYIDIYLNGSNTRIKKNSKYKSTRGIKEFKKSIVYLAVSFNEIEELKEKIQEYINELMFERDYKASEAYNELQNNINKIFKDIKLEIKFSGLNKNKEIFFTNSSGKKFSITELSTGEMTLLTKVLYLYLSEIKNQVILIDEPEMSLHPNWQNSILELYEIFAQKNNNQIIIATHSPHIISGAKSSYIRILELSNSKINVIDDYNQSYGLEVSRILTDIMGINSLRTPSVEKKIKSLKTSIIDNDHLVFNKLIKELENDLSDKDTDIKMLKLEMSMRTNSV